MNKRWWWFALAVVLIALEVFQFWQIHALKKAIEDTEWSIAVDERNDDNVITPEVGTIQFLKKGGYSIQLDAAKYIGDGLYLKGFVGNPTNLRLTNLAIKFSAQKNLYEYRDEFNKNKFVLFFEPSIGEAQCSPIAALGPGSRQMNESNSNANSVAGVDELIRGLWKSYRITGWFDRQT